MDDFAEKLRSVNFGGKTKSKTTTDDHGTHRVEVTESDNRQDVTVKVPTVRVRTTVEEN